MSRGIIAFINIPCRHCHALQTDHVDGRQCLFRSNVYEPESCERLHKVAAVCNFPGSIYSPGYLAFQEATANWALGRYWQCTTWRDGDLTVCADQHVPIDTMDR